MIKPFRSIKAPKSTKGNKIIDKKRQLTRERMKNAKYIKSEIDKVIRNTSMKKFGFKNGKRLNLIQKTAK